MVLLSAGAYKIANPVAFREYLKLLWPFASASAGLRGALVGLFAFVEVAIGASLLAPRLRREAGLAATMLLVAVTAVVVPQAWQGISCKCFPMPEALRSSGPLVLVRNALLITLALLSRLPLGARVSGLSQFSPRVGT